MTKNKQHYRGVISYVMKENIIKAVSDLMPWVTRQITSVAWRVGTACAIRFRSE